MLTLTFCASLLLLALSQPLTCMVCVDQGCGCCVVDDREACVCDRNEFDSGPRCNGGSRSFKTTASFACCEEGYRAALIIVLVVLAIVVWLYWLLELVVLLFEA